MAALKDGSLESCVLNEGFLRRSPKFPESPAVNNGPKDVWPQEASEERPASPESRSPDPF